MQSINLAWFMRLANVLRPLTVGTIDDENADFVFSTIRPYLTTLSDKNQFPLIIDASRPIVWALAENVDAVLEAAPEHRKEVLQARAGQIQEQAARLNMVLDTDLGHQPVFHVFPKRAYDVAILTSDATQLLSPHVRNALSEEEAFNIAEAGRCLAFEVPTSAAFHLFRAMDSLLQRYVVLVIGKKPRNRNWGAYIKDLEAAEVDKRVTGILAHIKDYFRNPIVHPEARVDVERALSLVGIAESAISMVVEDIISRTPLPTFDEADAVGATID